MALGSKLTFRGNKKTRGTCAPLRVGILAQITAHKHATPPSTRDLLLYALADFIFYITLLLLLGQFNNPPHGGSVKKPFL